MVQSLWQFLEWSLSLNCCQVSNVPVHFITLQEFHQQVCEASLSLVKGWSDDSPCCQHQGCYWWSTGQQTFSWVPGQSRQQGHSPGRAGAWLEVGYHQVIWNKGVQGCSEQDGSSKGDHKMQEMRSESHSMWPGEMLCNLQALWAAWCHCEQPGVTVSNPVPLYCARTCATAHSMWLSQQDCGKSFLGMTSLHLRLQDNKM